MLIVSTELWFSTARLSMALRESGCELVLLAPSKHPALLTGALTEFRAHQPLQPLRTLWQTLVDVNPQAVIPADERTVVHLQDIWLKAETSSSAAGRCVLQLLERSFGSREALSAARSRMHVLSLAMDEGVAIPDSVCVARETDLEEAAQRLGWPLVLKADMTSGGNGVAIAADLNDAHRSWRKLHHPPNILRALRRGILFKNWAHLHSCLTRESSAIMAQRFVRGPERTSMAMCCRGEVIASVCLEVAETLQARGPSSVLRVVEDPAMVFAMQRVASRLCLSGFCGFDFIVPEGSSNALMIEINPRPTQISHLTLGAGRDLISAYMRSVLGVPVEDRPAVSSGELIALFPQEMIRDPNSEFIRSAYLDASWESPALMRHALHPLPDVITKDPRWQG